VFDLFRFVQTWGIFALLSFLAAREAAIVGGIYKDPLLARFRRYGPEEDERRFTPLVVLLALSGAWCISGITVLRSLSRYGALVSTNSPTTILVVLAFMAFGAAVFVNNQGYLREALPVWYYQMLQTATREERRFIAYAWLRLPRRMRWRLSGDQRAFGVWADMVRIAFIYGAYDPNSTWDRWQ